MCPPVRKVSVAVPGRRVTLHSGRDLGQGRTSLAFQCPLLLSLAVCPGQVPASHEPFLSFPIDKGGWSQAIPKDSPTPCISAVRRLKRPAKGSWPDGKLTERRASTLENSDTLSPNPTLVCGEDGDIPKASPSSQGSSGAAGSHEGCRGRKFLPGRDCGCTSSEHGPGHKEYRDISPLLL